MIKSDSCGIRIVYGLPGSGKTYFLCSRALDSLRRGRDTVTDFPVRGALRFDEELLHGAMIYDSDIYLDEAYKYFNSRNFKNFSRSMHEFFSLHRHNGNVIYLGTQHPARLDVIIRELADDFVCVSNTKLFGRVLWFTYCVYLDDPVSVPHGMLKPTSVSRSLFRMSVASSYDTHALRSSDQPLELVPW